ncbi:TSL-kinase interacting protein 1-like isoform X1 [Silene latifolia]|uniref:TSL-kinase interacting protein 1-like isoform X1 n=1 Tax=Silene latifolia TaxID=37657 RepID=UPI003D76A666
MKSAKQLSRIKVRASLQGSIKKSAVVKKSQKSFGGQPKRKSECPSEQGEYNSDKSLNPENISKMPLDINQRDKKVHHPSKIKLQLLPLDERTHAGLEKDGRNPFLELTLSARKKISSVLTHLFNKWGNSSIALGELTLFPFNAVVENLTAFKSWSSRDSGITVGDVHSAVGSPEIFRLRYGWISSHLNSFTSPTVCSRLECAGSGAVEAASGLENQTNAKNKELVPRIMNGKLNKSVRMTALSNKPSNSEIQTDQALVNSEVLKPSQTTEIERHSIEERHYSTEPVRLEEARTGRELSQPSVLLSDLSNISIGGLLSEASLQGRFNASGSSRLNFQPSVDSMDAFINKINSSNVSTTIDMPSSILDADDTCHSFLLSKPSSTKDFLSLGRGAFSGLSSHDAASRPSRFFKSEANVQNGENGCNAVQKPSAEPLPCSAGVYNNENSLGLSSIRWSDSLGPFDIPLIPRQITKDDSLSLGGFFR